MRGEVEMLKNEIRIFLNKKNLLCLFVGIISVMLVYHFDYLKAYNNYSETRLTQIKENSKDIDIYAKAYQLRLERLRKQYPGHPKTEEAEIMARVWSTYSFMNTNLQTYWKWPDRYEKKISEAEEKLDVQLAKVSEQKVEVGISNLYRNTERDWKQRMEILEKYKKANHQIPINKVIPTGAYVLNEALSGLNLVFLIMLILVIIWNFDSWSADFEQATYKIIFTLPYPKKKIFFLRLLTRFIITIIGLGIILGVLFIRGCLKFGAGFENYIVLNTTATNTLGFFKTSWKALMRTDIAVPISYSIGLRAFIITLFLLFIIAIIHFISFSVKNQMGTLIVTVAGIISVATYTLYPKENMEVSLNPLLYFQTGNALSGMLGIGIPLLLIVLMMSTVFLLVITMVWFEKREL